MTALKTGLELMAEWLNAADVVVESHAPDGLSTKLAALP